MPQTAFKTALIVDDHPLFCDALAMTLQSVSGIERVLTAPDLATSLNIVRDSPPDVVVLDLNLPDVKGMDGLVRLLQATDAPVLIVSSMNEDKIITLALRAGASGFVPKHSQRDVFGAALEALSGGKVFAPAGYSVAHAAAETTADDAVARLATLTAQQARILQLICEGKLNKQIAFDLSIADTTVKAHVTAIMRKLGVQSRTQAVLLSKEASFGTLLQGGQHSA